MWTKQNMACTNYSLPAERLGLGMKKGWGGVGCSMLFIYSCHEKPQLAVTYEPSQYLNGFFLCTSDYSLEISSKGEKWNHHWDKTLCCKSGHKSTHLLKPNGTELELNCKSWNQFHVILLIVILMESKSHLTYLLKYASNIDSATPKDLHVWDKIYHCEEFSFWFCHINSRWWNIIYGNILFSFFCKHCVSLAVSWAKIVSNALVVPVILSHTHTTFGCIAERLGKH